ncbi:hydroxyquinol 1,2-dioxygenase [Streptomyces sp. NBC_01707]|jgi:hydroxyquinol 1,2-dioxygenase|uniref:dioxygenase family protein n=1 Tax=unclassified Streptomyces TaxID=2593676 RepID=UPI0029BEFCAC|nr:MULTISPECIES: dioxygenase [unclassified Streptomyces]MDX3767727.1 dioxygenase [Streptomyces sp. AK08-01B]MDX3820609.1 dioxygenase [Streptomyces sp. AK08-01A]
MRDLTIDTITEAVISTMRDTKDSRVAEIAESLVRHVHAFVREVQLTEEEWARGVDFLTRTGQTCTPTRQEFILLSDVLGVTILVDALSNQRPAEATQNSVLGPFFRGDRPQHLDGADISGGLPGTSLFFEGRVVNREGAPVAGAAVDVWHSDAEGHYDVDVPDRVDPAMRALFWTDETGNFSFRSIRPSSYPIPGDGPVGELMSATNRSLMRPAHVHLLIEAPGFQRVTTMLFPSDDPHLDADPVFGVKDSLVESFETFEADAGPRRGLTDEPYTVLRHTFVLEPRPAD